MAKLLLSTRPTWQRNNFGVRGVMWQRLWHVATGMRVPWPQKTARWIKMTFWSRSWRSLHLWKGHLSIPKRPHWIARCASFLFWEGVGGRGWVWAHFLAWIILEEVSLHKSILSCKMCILDLVCVCFMNMYVYRLIFTHLHIYTYIYIYNCFFTCVYTWKLNDPSVLEKAGLGRVPPAK